MSAPPPSSIPERPSVIYTNPLQRQFRVTRTFLKMQALRGEEAYKAIMFALSQLSDHPYVERLGAFNPETLVMAAAGYLLVATCPPAPSVEYRFPPAVVASEYATSSDIGSPYSAM